MRLILTIIFMSTLGLSSNYAAKAHHPAVPFTSTYFITNGTKPVEFKNLTCVRKEDRIALSWSIQNNESADRLIVQRSQNGKKFEMAGLVFGTDKNSNDQYQFFETNKSRKAYYRVIVVNKDKTVSYSPVVRVASEK